MALAYLCLARNDVDANLLQVLDLKPNSSQRVPSLTSDGQTGYLTYLPQHDTVATTAPGGVITTSANYQGLAAYLWDNVCDADNADIHLTAARCNTISDALLAAVGLGTALTSVEIDAAIQAATGGAASHLSSAKSIGTVEDVMKILSGEVYYLPSGSTSGAAAAFTDPHYRKGRFLEANAVGSVFCVAVANNDTVTIGGLVFTAKTAGADIPNLYFLRGGADNTVDAQSLCDVINDHRTQTKIKLRNNGYTVTATVASNKVTLHASVPGTPGELTLTSSNGTRLPVLAPDWVSGGHRPFRKILDTGDLHISAATGVLSKLKAATFAWLNPAFTYGAAGTAFKVNGTTHIAATGVGAAVTVYDASGNVI